MATTSRSRRRKIKELLDVLYDPNCLWRPIHTSMMLKIIKTEHPEGWRQIDKDLAKEYAERRKELAELRKSNELDRQKVFKEELEFRLPKIASQLEALTDFAFAKATITNEETGEQTLDPTLIKANDAKVALQALTMVLKALGLQTTKVENVKQGEAFDYLDDVEAVEG